MNTELIYSSLFLLNSYAYYKLQKNNNINMQNKKEILLIFIIKFFGIFVPSSLKVKTSNGVLTLAIR